MTNEQKLLKLLQIAVENGWNIDNLPHLSKCALRFSPTIEGNTIVSKAFTSTYMSLNDLVCNWEEGEVSFIDALLTATPEEQVFSLIDDVGAITNLQDLIYYNWTYRPTSKRLDWLFETFKHLTE